MVNAILAKLSEPKNDLGLITMNSPFSSKERRASRSSGKDILTSFRDRVLEPSGDDVGAATAGDAWGLGAETVTVGLGADTGTGLSAEEVT